MASLGLLGALGGLGQGLTQTGKMMYDEETEKARERRLQAIRDRDYARARKDAVADMDRKFKEQKDLISIEQKYKTSEREAAQTFASKESLDIFNREQKALKERATSKLGQMLQDRAMYEDAGDMEQVGIIDAQIAVEQGKPIFEYNPGTYQMEAFTPKITRDVDNNVVIQWSKTTFGDDGTVSSSPGGPGGISPPAPAQAGPSISGLTDSELESQIQAVEQAIQDGNFMGTRGGRPYESNEREFRARLQSLREEMQRRRNRVGSRGNASLTRDGLAFAGKP